MTDIGIGIVGGGYMGKAHSVAYSAVGPVFETALRPRLEMIAASSPESAERYAKAYGFRRAARDWRELVAAPQVEAVIIAAPQTEHRAIAEAAFALRKPVFCEKPLGATLEDAEAMVAAAKASAAANMIGFNYIRTPASQFARKLIADDRIGRVIWFRCEHTEDFHVDVTQPATWRISDPATGALGDLAPHIINAAHGLMGPIDQLSARVERVHEVHGGQPVRNDDQLQLMCRFQNGAMGHMFVSRVAPGRKMGYAYEIHGTKGAIRFDQEDQNALHLYDANAPVAEMGFRKILTGPAHPDYLAFCQGAGHGTGYQDQIIIEAKDFLEAIETGAAIWPSFEEGLAVARVIDAVRRSDASGMWTRVKDDEK